MARDEDEPGSDIDVLVVTEDGASAVHAEEIAAEEGAAEEGVRYFTTYGKPLSIIAKTRGELRRRKPAFVREAMRDGILLAGSPLKEAVDATG